MLNTPAWKLGLVWLAGSLLALPAWAAPDAPSPSPTASPATDALADIRIVLHTSHGDIKAALFPSKAPLAVASFLNLVQHKFFDGLKFHRVITGFVIQGGDPDGTGGGGPGMISRMRSPPSSSTGRGFWRWPIAGW